MTDNNYDVYSKFDIEKHKEKYVNYLEVIIKADGSVDYAVPSHQEYLIKAACEKLNVSRIELDMLCPIEYYCDFIYWLCKITESVSVWDNFYVGDINEKHLKTLTELKEHGLYKGKIGETE